METYVHIFFVSRGLDPDFDAGKVMCEWCGERVAVDVDHIRGRIGEKLYDPFNLIGLCRECHQQHKTSQKKTILSSLTYRILSYVHSGEDYTYEIVSRLRDESIREFNELGRG